MVDRLPELSWREAAEAVERVTFRIEIGGFLGTGFIFSAGRDPVSGELLGFVLATARHVVDEPLLKSSELQLFSSSGHPLLDPARDSVEAFHIGPKEFDTTAIFVRSSREILALEHLRPVYPVEWLLPRGAEVAWLGFPGLVAPELCLFSGLVSGHLRRPDSYLVDGVAINGVSGGPAFDRKGQLVGLISAYIPNRRPDGSILPGLLSIVPVNLMNLWLQDEQHAKVV